MCNAASVLKGPGVLVGNKTHPRQHHLHTPVLKMSVSTHQHKSPSAARVTGHCAFSRSMWESRRGGSANAGQQEKRGKARTTLAPTFTSKVLESVFKMFILVQKIFLKSRPDGFVCLCS